MTTRQCLCGALEGATHVPGCSPNYDRDSGPKDNAWLASQTLFNAQSGRHGPLTHRIQTVFPLAEVFFNGAAQPEVWTLRNGDRTPVLLGNSHAAAKAVIEEMVAIEKRARERAAD